MRIGRYLINDIECLWRFWQDRMVRLLTALVVLYYVRCDENIYYEYNNMTCVMCPPGSHWVGHCLTNGASAVCAPCPDNQYLPTYNRAIYCKQCRTSCWNQNHEHESVQREGIVQACTRILDIQCQCKEGYWRKVGTNDVCLRVSTCGQGQGVKTKATPNSDTVCGDCVEGETFSNVSSTTSPCLPCSSCGADEILQRSCTRTEDTLCADRSTTGRTEFVMGLGIGIPLLVLVAIGVVLYVFCCCRRSKTDSEDKVKLQVNSATTHEVVSGTEHQANGTAFHGKGPQPNVIATRVLIDETKSSDTAVHEQSAQVMIRYARIRANGSGAASQANGALVNEIATHGLSAQDQENDTEENVVKNGPEYLHNACIGKGKTAVVIPEGKKADVKNQPAHASDPDLFMQKVFCDLSEEMDGTFRMFFRKNGISESVITVIEEEYKRVKEQCFKLFLAWENNQTDVRELPAMEIPLELVGRLTLMFLENTDMHCSRTCLDVLERHENLWIRQFRRETKCI